MEKERFFESLSNLVSANIHVLRDSYGNKKSYFSTNLNLNPTINRRFVEFDKNHYDFYSILLELITRNSIVIIEMKYEQRDTCFPLIDLTVLKLLWRQLHGH